MHPTTLFLSLSGFSGAAKSLKAFHRMQIPPHYRYDTVNYRQVFLAGNVSLIGMH